MDHNLGTLVPSKVAFIPHESIRELANRHPNVSAALWRDTLIDAAIFREWLIGVGSRSPTTRIAHLLCELLLRFRAVGLTDDYAYDLPIEQSEVGDALGLTAADVNRILMELEQQGLVRAEGRTLIVDDWDGLKKIGEFDPRYLHLRG
jgi:CRP-like cAMP-binding protein